MIEIITTENKSLGKYELEYHEYEDGPEYVLHGDHYIRIPQKLYQHLFTMELHGLPKHSYFDKKEDCIEHDGQLLKHFYLIQ